MEIRYAAVTRTGLVRERNEDAVLADGWVSTGDARLSGRRILSDTDQSTFAVFDGMGGHAAGDVASHLAAAQLGMRNLDLESESGIVNAVSSMNQLVASAGQMVPSFAGMGSTVVAVAVRASGYWLFHAGDSLAFRFVHDRMGQLTVPDRIPHPHYRGQTVITEALGQQDPAATIVQFPILGPQRLMLCSDGIHDVLARDVIEGVLAEPDPQGAAERLVDLAYQLGAPDNASAVVVDLAPARTST